MKLTVLGKYGPYPKAGATACSGYIVREKNTALVLDFGSGTLARLQEQMKIEDITAIYISHLHYDHTSDLLPFRYLLEDLNHTVTVYVAKEDTPYYGILFNHPNFKVINIDENSEIKCGDLTLTFYLMDHPVKNYAVKIKGEKTLVYTGDTRYNDNLYNAAKNADAILADCSKPVGFKGPHMTLDKTVEFYNKTKIKIFATHLSPDYSPEKDFAPYEGISVVNELQTYEI